MSIWKRFAYNGKYTWKGNTLLRKNFTHQGKSTHKGDVQIRVYNHTYNLEGGHPMKKTHTLNNVFVVVYSGNDGSS